MQILMVNFLQINHSTLINKNQHIVTLLGNMIQVMVVSIVVSYIGGRTKIYHSGKISP